MHTGKQDVYAAGDVTSFPLFMADDREVNIQHWQMAHQQGETDMHLEAHAFKI